jgi:RND family efflux transporter MFP subunit
MTCRPACCSLRSATACLTILLLYIKILLTIFNVFSRIIRVVSENNCDHFSLVESVDSMNRRYLFCLCVSALIALGFGNARVTAEPKILQPQLLQRPLFAAGAIEVIPEPGDYRNGSVEATVINPYQSANIGPEISGIIESLSFEEGDFVNKGDVIAEISKERYALLAEKARETVKALELDYARAQQDERLKQELFSFDASTRQELLKTQAEREILAAKLKEANAELKVALLNLSACSIRAPFSGYLAVRYKQPFEPVERLEKIVSMVDSSKVYAVANIGENLLVHFRKGTEAIFIDSYGHKFKGKVAKVGKLIDPKSKTKKVYLLIENSKGELEVGMTGSLQLPK